MVWGRRPEPGTLLAMGGVLGLFLGLVLGYYLAQGQWDRQCVLEKKVMIHAAEEREKEWDRDLMECADDASYWQTFGRKCGDYNRRIAGELERVKEVRDQCLEKEVTP